VFNRWRDEIAAGAQRAHDLSADMAALVQKMMAMTFVVGLAAGLVIGGFLVWLTK
jgi:hypothetical protein